MTMAQQPLLTTLPGHTNDILIAFMTYSTLFWIISPLATAQFLPRLYQSYPRRTRISWNVRTTSTIQASLICSRALHTILTDHARSQMGAAERLTEYSPASGKTQSFAAGYFFWDLLISICYYDVLGLGSLVHAMSALLVTMLGFRPFANYYGINFVLYELSTPFLNFHWFMEKTGLSGSALQVINGMCLMTSFFGCRVVWGLYQSVRLYADARVVWSDYATAANLKASNSSKKTIRLDTADIYIMWIFVVANTILSGLNLYWFTLMARSFRRRLKKVKE